MSTSRWITGTVRLVGLLQLLLLTGCGRPQATPQNLLLISSLRTAASTRNPELVEKNAALVAERREAGAMTDAEHRIFQAILELARAKKWEQAEREAWEFQKAQRPSAEQIERVKNRTTLHDHP
ncbi:MAG: hypothetical protein MUF48_20880 [Pirellulaceae bacterium]|jgi:hypothetical protein|nr:hypothetical protein [Pirellulaceae bacterium]